MTVFWCQSALLPTGAASGVTVTVDGEWIVGVEADTVAPPGSVRLNGLTIPGLANTHSHAFHRALRSRTQAETGSFWTWRKVMYEAAARLTPDNYHRLARGAYAEMVAAGLTSVGEFHYVHHQADGTPYQDPNAMGEALVAAADEVGITITLLDTIYLHGGLGADGYQPVEGPQRRFSDGDVDRWIARVDDLAQPGEGVKVGAAIHSVRAVDPHAMETVAGWTAARRMPLHAHVSEQVGENEACQAFHRATPVELLDQAGALRPGFCAVHATHLTGDDRARLARSGSSVCLCPTTESDLGDGIGPSTELAEAGVEIHLGSDSHAVVDHFVETRSVELFQRLRHQRRGLHPAADLLAMATVNGHRALGWDQVGLLSPGHRADLVTVDLESPRTAGAEATVETVVFAATAADVTSVVCRGRTVVADRRHVTVEVETELSTVIKELLG